MLQSQGGVLVAWPQEVDEGYARPVHLETDLAGGAGDLVWAQVQGPRVPLRELGSGCARLDVSGLDVAADVELVFQVADGVSTATASVVVRALEATLVATPAKLSTAAGGPASLPYSKRGPLDPFLGENVQIGGQTTSVTTFQASGLELVAFNVGSRFSITTMTPVAGPVSSLYLKGGIRDIEIVQVLGGRYALVAMGADGIAVVDLSVPAVPALVSEVALGYRREGVSYAEGGGDIVTDASFASTHATVSALASDGATLWIATQDYGLHRTALSNLLGPLGPALDPDGTLLVDAEVPTLCFAGEHPWGGPLTIERRGDRLFVALEFLGLGIFDATSLAQVGRYNLYTDVGMLEDWFLGMDVALEVQPGFLDPVTGMPTPEQASFEILQVWHGGVVAPTPWADFELTGKYYYNVRDVTVATHGSASIAYLAYGLGGLAAVDVTGYQAADPGAGFLDATYLACLPGVPAHGPDDPPGGSTPSLFPHYGSGKLVEAGYSGVRVFDGYVLATEHFAGLVALTGAEDPAALWHGAGAPYDNDTNGIPGDHVPDYEFVTSFDMSPFDPSDHESLPICLYEQPCVLATGEIDGHGRALALSAKMHVGPSPNADVALGAGAGGLDLVDVIDLTPPQMGSRFGVPVYLPTTEEIGADSAGLPLQTVAIGHTQGVAASGAYLYVADGPHGVSAWHLVDDAGYATDDVHLVANTLQDEYPANVGGTTVYPATHAFGVVYDPVAQSALTSCQGLGLRRVPVDEVEADLGHTGLPLLLRPQPTDLFEHKGDYGTAAGLSKQDHAFDVAIDGDLAFVADGGNGLTVYDLTKDPTVMDSGFLAGNLGGEVGAAAPLGNASGVALLKLPGKRYAFVAAGPKGVGVVDATDVTKMTLVKVFEPIKPEEDKQGKADGRAVDVIVRDGHVYFSYDSFGLVVYTVDDLLQPLPPGVEPTEIWDHGGTFDYRPQTVAELRLRDDGRYAHLGGGALYMAEATVQGRTTFFVAYGSAGLLRVDWSDPAAPRVMGVEATAGAATAVALAQGRVYVADGGGGLIFFK